MTSLNSDLDLDLWGFPATPSPQPVDPCAPWGFLSPAAPQGSTHSLIRDLTVIAPDDVWVVGDSSVGPIGAISGLNSAWHWDGIQWTSPPVPNPAPGTSLPNNALYAVDAAGPNDVYAVGYQSTTVPGGWYGPQLEVLHWDGSQWSLLPEFADPANQSRGRRQRSAHQRRRRFRSERRVVRRILDRSSAERLHHGARALDAL